MAKESIEFRSENRPQYSSIAPGKRVENQWIGGGYLRVITSRKARGKVFRKILIRGYDVKVALLVIAIIELLLWVSLKADPLPKSLECFVVILVGYCLVRISR
jgi:hypothetical protein